MNTLVDQGPDKWLTYLTLFEKQQADSGLNMQVVFQFAAPRAKAEMNLEWAEVAVRAAELEAARVSGVEQENALGWAMNLRAWFISRIGFRSGHTVLDEERINTWIRDGLSVPLEEVKQEVVWFWQTLAELSESSKVEDRVRMSSVARELHNIKRRLDVALVLSESGHFGSRPDLDEWSKIQKQLP